MAFRKNSKAKHRCGRCKRPFIQMPHGYIDGVPYGTRCFLKTVAEIHAKGLSANIIDYTAYQSDLKDVGIMVREAEIVKKRGELPEPHEL